MKNNIIAILICLVTYVIVKMFMGDFKFESDTYGYYKDGKLNERGLISIVTDAKRNLPIKTADTTVFDINYIYKSENDPKPIINYFHQVDKDKVTFYRENSSAVASNLATSQCDQKEILEMLEKLDRITISFYDQKDFLYAVEISEEICKKISPQKVSVDPKAEEKAKKAITQHVTILKKNLPIKMELGALIDVLLEPDNSVTYIFTVGDEQTKAYNSRKSELNKKIVSAYCNNSKMRELLSYVPYLEVEFRNGEIVVAKIKVEETNCK